MGNFTKTRILLWKIFKFWEAGKYGLKIFGAKYQKAHPYAKTGKINRLVYVSVAVF